jgi:hypothetical protein
MKKSVCAGCGAEWIEGEGFECGHKHTLPNGEFFMCANERYGWNFTVEVEVPETELEAKP